MTRGNPHYQTLCDEAGRISSLDAAVTMLQDPSTRRHELEKDLGPLSETELRELAATLPPAFKDLDKHALEKKLGSLRGIMPSSSRLDNDDRLPRTLNGLRARWKLLDMEERGSKFKSQAAATSPTNRPLQQQQASHQFSSGIPPTVRQQSSSAVGLPRSNSARQTAALAPQQQRQQQPDLQVVPSFSQTLQRENLHAYAQQLHRGPQQQQEQQPQQPQQQVDRQLLLNRPMSQLAVQPGVRPAAAAHQQQPDMTHRFLLGQFKNSLIPNARQQQQSRPSSIGGGLQQQGPKRQAPTPAQRQLQNELSRPCASCQVKHALKSMQEFQGTFICTHCVKTQQEQEQWLATQQQQQQPAPKSRLQGFKAPLRLDKLPPGQVSAAAHGPAAAGARPRRQAAVKPGSKDTPITIDSDDDADGGSDAGDLIVPGPGPSAAAAEDGGGPRRSQRISLVQPGPNTAQRFAGLRCLFPAGGGPGAVEVVAEDLSRLDPDEFLNDTIIDYYIKKVELALPPEVRARCHFFNSFFFKKLTEKSGGSSGAAGGGSRAKPDAEEAGRLNYERVKKWTKGVDVFSKDYLFVPIHDTLHWSLAIICHPGMLPDVAAVDAAAASSGKTAAQAAAAAAEARAAAAVADGGGGDAAAAAAADSDADAGGEDGAAEPAAAAGGGVEKRPVIIHLDSMTGGHTGTAVGRALGSYLEQEWAHRHGHRSSHHHSKQQQQDAAAGGGGGGPHSGTQLQITTTAKGNMPCVRVRQLPRQDNHCDCGLFLLTYLESFTHHLPPAVSPDAVSGRKGAPALSVAHPNLLRLAWFDPSLASVLRGQLRYELLQLMISQAADKDSSAVAQAAADCAEYQQSMALQQQRIQRSEPGEIVAYVGPQHYGEVHKLLEMYRQRLKREAANRRQAARSSSRQLQLQQEGGGGRTTNAERKRALELAAAAAEKRAAAAAAPVAEAAAADAAAVAAAAAGLAYAGPEVDMQQEEDCEQQQQQQFHSPLPDLFEIGWASQELVASPPAAAPAAAGGGGGGGGGRGNSSRPQPPTCGLDASSDSDLDDAIRAATAAAAAGSDAAAASPSQRKRKAAPQQQQQEQAPAQGKQGKRQRQQQQQQHPEQQQLHPEQQEDAIEEPQQQQQQQPGQQQQQQPGGRRRMPEQQPQQQHAPAAGAGDQQQQPRPQRQQQRRRRLPIPDDAGGSCDDDDSGDDSPARQSSSFSMATDEGDADDEDTEEDPCADVVSEDFILGDGETSAQQLSMQLLADLYRRHSSQSGVNQLLQRLRGRFAPTNGNNLAAAVGMPGFVDRSERQEMLGMLQEYLQQDLAPHLLQPLLDTLQKVVELGAADEQFSAAWRELIQAPPRTLRPAVLRPPPPPSAAAAGAGPSQRPPRRSPTAVKTSAAIAAAAVDPKQRKITQMVRPPQQRQRQQQQPAEIVYAASHVPIPGDTQRLMEAIQAGDNEPPDGEEEQVLHCHPLLRALQQQPRHQQQQPQQQQRRQQQQHDVCDMTLDGSSDEGGDGKQQQGGQTWACAALPLGNADQQKQQARLLQRRVQAYAAAALDALSEDDEDTQPSAAAAAAGGAADKCGHRAGPVVQQRRPDAAGGGAGSRTRRAKQQQQQQQRRAGAGSGGHNLMAVGPTLAATRQALQQQQPGDGADNSHSLFEMGAAALQASRQPRGLMGMAVRAMQQLLPGVVCSPGQQQQQHPVCSHPPEQPLVDYPSESKQTSLPEDELLPTQPAGAGEVTSPLPAKAAQQQASAAAATAAAAAMLQQRVGAPRRATLAQVAQQAAGQAAAKQAQRAADGGTIVIDSDTDND